MKRIGLFLLAVVMVVGLAGCATTEGYRKVVSSWEGAEEVALVRSLGAPSNVYWVGSTKFIVYESGRNVYLPGASPTYKTTYYGNSARTQAVGGFPGMNISKSCTTTFEIYSERVVSWSFRGNDCTAVE